MESKSDDQSFIDSIISIVSSEEEPKKGRPQKSTGKKSKYIKKQEDESESEDEKSSKPAESKIKACKYFIKSQLDRGLAIEKFPLLLFNDFLQESIMSDCYQVVKENSFENFIKAYQILNKTDKQSLSLKNENKKKYKKIPEESDTYETSHVKGNAKKFKEEINRRQETCKQILEEIFGKDVRVMYHLYVDEKGGLNISKPCSSYFSKNPNRVLFRCCGFECRVTLTYDLEKRRMIMRSHKECCNEPKNLVMKLKGLGLMEIKMRPNSGYMLMDKDGKLAYSEDGDYY